MFTGIIEALGQVKDSEAQGTNKSFWIQSPLTPELKVDQSIAHNGVCLTVEAISGDSYRVTAVAETLKKTTLQHWQPGAFINLERSLLPSSRLDGHFVQGHVDGTGRCTRLKDKNGSWELEFSFPKKYGPLVIEKGSICVNGVSLTAFDVKANRFRVALIPYTWQHTNLQYLEKDSLVNLEFDLVGKYILRSKIIHAA